MDGWLHWVNSFDVKGAFFRDCGARGNCQFLVVSRAIQPVLYLTPETLRRLVAKQVENMSDIDFQTLMTTYRQEVIDETFDGMWNPMSCHTRQDFAQAVTRPNLTGNGWEFQGDHLTLDLLAGALNVRIILFCRERHMVVDLSPPDAPSTIFLLYHNKHYQLLGAPYTSSCR